MGFCYRVGSILYRFTRTRAFIWALLHVCSMIIERATNVFARRVGQRPPIFYCSWSIGTQPNFEAISHQEKRGQNYFHLFSFNQYIKRHKKTGMHFENFYFWYYWHALMATLPLNYGPRSHLDQTLVTHFLHTSESNHT